MTVDTIAEAVWTYEPRALASGTPGAAVTYEELAAEAVWTYEPRALAEPPEPARPPMLLTFWQ